MKPWLLSIVLPAALATLGASESPQLRLSRIQDLRFGVLVVGSGGGSAELTPEGLLKPSSGLRLPTGIMATVGRIAVEGPPRQAFQLDFDPVRPTLSGVSGTPRIERFILLPEGGAFTLDGNGHAELRVGAVLDVPAGSYTGLYRVSPDVQVRARLTGPGAKSVACLPVVLPIQATLRSPLSLDCLRSLHFGDLVPGPGGGALSVAPDGSYAWNGASPAHFLRQRPVAARFHLLGAAGSGYGLRLPLQEVHLSGPKGTLTVRNFTTDAPLEGLLPAGGLDFGVGATLVLPPEALGGAYSGTFRVEVIYN